MGMWKQFHINQTSLSRLLDIEQNLLFSWHQCLPDFLENKMKNKGVYYIKWMDTNMEFDIMTLGYRVVKLPACTTLQLRHNGHDGVSIHQSHDCLLNRLFRRRSKKTPKLSVTGLCTGNSPVTGEFPTQMASNAENVSIWLRHHAMG